MKTRKWSEKPGRKSELSLYFYKEKTEIKDEQTKTEFSLSLSFFLAQSITKTKCSERLEWYKFNLFV